MKKLLLYLLITKLIKKVKVDIYLRTILFINSMSMFGLLVNNLLLEYMKVLLIKLDCYSYIMLKCSIMPMLEKMLLMSSNNYLCLLELHLKYSANSNYSLHYLSPMIGSVVQYLHILDVKDLGMSLLNLNVSILHTTQTHYMKEDYIQNQKMVPQILFMNYLTNG